MKDKRELIQNWLGDNDSRAPGFMATVSDEHLDTIAKVFNEGVDAQDFTDWLLGRKFEQGHSFRFWPHKKILGVECYNDHQFSILLDHTSFIRLVLEAGKEEPPIQFSTIEELLKNLIGPKFAAVWSDGSLYTAAGLDFKSTVSAREGLRVMLDQHNLEGIRRMENGINLDYLHYVPSKANEQFNIVRYMVKLGFRLSDMFPYVKRKNANKLLGVLDVIPLNHQRFSFSRTSWPGSPMVFSLLYRDSLPEEALRYLRYDEVAEWAVRHRDRLEREQAKGHTKYYLLEYVDPDTLTQGIRTAFDKVMATAKVKFLADNDYPDDGALPLFPYPISDPKIRQITTIGELIQEGAAMRHCVGSYIGTCLDSKTYIFHIDDGTAKGATAEVEICNIVIADDPVHRPFKTVTVCQCKGPFNNPADEADKMVEAMAEKLNQEIRAGLAEIC